MATNTEKGKMSYIVKTIIEYLDLFNKLRRKLPNLVPNFNHGKKLPLRLAGVVFIIKTGKL